MMGCRTIRNFIGPLTRSCSWSAISVHKSAIGETLHIDSPVS
jgi:hypothetical protein